MIEYENYRLIPSEHGLNRFDVFFKKSNIAWGVEFIRGMEIISTDKLRRDKETVSFEEFIKHYKKVQEDIIHLYHIYVKK